jgi:hypothetical protein
MFNFLDIDKVLAIMYFGIVVVELWENGVRRKIAKKNFRFFT